MSEANTDVQVKEPDYLNMSDEEIRNMTGPVAGSGSVEEDEDDESSDDQDKDQDASGTQDADDSAADKSADEEKDDDEPADGDDEGADKATKKDPAEVDDVKDDEQKAAANADAAKADGQKDSDKAEDKKPQDESTINFETEYKRLLTPFKANGRDIQVGNVDEAITLMQMGANYNKKMAALKPNLKLMKLLEKSGLLSEDKISFLIDLNRKDPAAINKLVNDSGIDPMDLTADKASAYKQTAYTVDDREIELDTVLDDLQESPSYNRTLEIVGTKWDAASKQVVAGNPAIMRVINDHVSSGIYDRIQKEIDNERMFGRLIGLSDIEAYRQVGDSLHARGAFNSLVQGSSQPKQQTEPAQKVVVQPKPKQDDDDKRKDKKRAASSTKSAVSDSGAQDFNPLSMSDEEFSKHVNKQFL